MVKGDGEMNELIITAQNEQGEIILSGRELHEGGFINVRNQNGAR
jgi:hypothetical protein